MSSSWRKIASVFFHTMKLWIFGTLGTVRPNPRLKRRNSLRPGSRPGKGWSLTVTHVAPYDIDVILPVKEKDSTWLLGIQYAFN